MTQFNEDELEAPSWMNEGFFTEVLKKYEKTDKILLRELQITPASAKGDHYASVMFRGAVTYDSNKSKGNSKSLIIKTIPELSGLKKDLLDKSNVFETEIAMYSDTIPKFEAELRKIGDNTVLGANVLYYSLKPNKVIIFEDICPKGYVVLRDRQCTLEEIKGAYLKLAKWHAVSYKLAAEGDSVVTGYKESFLASEACDEIPFINHGMDNFIDKLETIEDLKHFIPSLEKIRNDVLQRAKNSGKMGQQSGSQGIFALCHGDFHRKNMMFKNNANGEFEDVLLLDFQMCYYGPAILDVFYGMYMLADENLRINNYDEIIHYYSSNFIECLKKMNFQGEIPKIADFFIEILRHRYFELFMLTSFLPLWMAFASRDLDPNDIMSSNEVCRSIYDNDEYINEVRRILPTMFYRGFLEK